MRDLEAVLHQLDTLKARARGLRLAVDDFGSGYASFSYLRDLPVDTLKIDRTFIADIGQGGKRVKKARALVKTMVNLGRNLGLGVVAEGVELSGQATFLRSVSCDRGQGFLYAPAIERDAFAERFLRS